MDLDRKQVAAGLGSQPLRVLSSHGSSENTKLGRSKRSGLVKKAAARRISHIRPAEEREVAELLERINRGPAEAEAPADRLLDLEKKQGALIEALRQPMLAPTQTI